MFAKYAMFQMVTLLEAHENLLAGTSGTVLHIYKHTHPTVYEVEFMDCLGNTHMHSTGDIFTYTIAESLLAASNTA
jgi:hypothetical protein